MDNQIDLINDEIPAYRKKSKKKGSPRANHKHTYETVLLTRYYHCNFGEPRVLESKQPTKVCTICGRIDHIDNDESLYEIHSDNKTKWALVKDLSEKALNLPKWHVDAFDKFAIKEEAD